MSKIDIVRVATFDKMDVPPWKCPYVISMVPRKRDGRS